MSVAVVLSIGLATVAVLALAVFAFHQLLARPLLPEIPGAYEVRGKETRLRYAAERAYNAYGARRGGVLYRDGRPLPPFHVLEPELQDAWMEAVRAGMATYGHKA